MKMLLPPKSTCRKIDKFLTKFYELNCDDCASIVHKDYFENAIFLLCMFYDIDYPKIRIINSFKPYHKKGCNGLCYESGFILLLHPAKFKTHYCNYSWESMVYHEFGHYCYYANAEEKANCFERQMLGRCVNAIYHRTNKK